jgi:hypothetical protein
MTGPGCETIVGYGWYSESGIAIEAGTAGKSELTAEMTGTGPPTECGSGSRGSAGAAAELPSRFQKKK